MLPWLAKNSSWAAGIKAWEKFPQRWRNEMKRMWTSDKWGVEELAGMKGASAERMFLSPARQGWGGAQVHALDTVLQPLHILSVVSFCPRVYAVPQPCPMLCSPMDYSPPGSSAHGIFQARILEWGAISFSRASSQPKDRTRISCIICTGRQILYH